MAEKQLKIKFGVLKRVQKDLQYYTKEVSNQKNKVNKMKEDGKDEYDIRKQEEVLQESEAMIPDCESRLQAAARDLQEFVDTHENDEGVKDTELLSEVKQLLASAQ